MKAIVVGLLLALVGATLPGTALAGRGHVHLGVVIGPWAPWHYAPRPYYYPPPHYYPPPVYYVPPPVTWTAPAPTTYVERTPAPPADAPAAPTYWYYCPDSKAYYPYVRDCAGAWERVAPQPPGAVQER